MAGQSSSNGFADMLLMEGSAVGSSVSELGPALARHAKPCAGHGISIFFGLHGNRRSKVKMERRAITRDWLPSCCHTALHAKNAEQSLRAGFAGWTRTVPWRRMFARERTGDS